MLTFEEFAEANKKRQATSYPRLKDWTLSDWATALAGETGEMCNLIKKRNRGEHIETEDIGREIADIVTYADLLATKLGLSLEEAVKKKFNEVSDRKGSDIKL